MKKALCIVLPILICFAVGYISSRFQLESLADWYPTINKSPLSPPNYAFPIAWSILYICMGVSIGLILITKDVNKSGYISIFLLQLLLNFSWSINFFYLQNPSLGLINILFLDIVVLYYIIKTFNTERISSLLFVPYFIWISFATYLNLYIVLYN